LIINARIIGSKNTILDFKTLYSTSITHQHLNGKFGKVRKYDRNRFPEADDKLIRASTFIRIGPSGNDRSYLPGTIGLAEEIFNGFGVHGS
jgi:hypothetical protein